MPTQSRSGRAVPCLSVITPAYNVEQYLSGCIESILRQTFADFELIVVDDGSTDRTPDIIAKYAAADPRVRGFRGPNRGVAHARNVAMRQAGGRYLALLDADDEWDPEFAGTIVSLMERQPDIGLVSANAINLGGGSLDGMPVKPWPAEPHEVRFIDMIRDEQAMFIMTVFRRSVYETLGGFNEKLARSEDYEYWLRAAAAGFTVLSYPKPLGRYRRRADSMSSDHAGMIEAITTVLVSAREFRTRPRTDELNAIDRQLDKLQGDRLLILGKEALMRRRFVEARSHFTELYRRTGRWPYYLVAVGLKVAPTAVLAAYRLRVSGFERRAARQRHGDRGTRVRLQEQPTSGQAS